ncbi:unnamed protein product [Effrenium voratum]|uniref:UBC core domain-containing protein n=1 Tax=Effrenium voratum TaxID=2562239 RepID=A0AA36I2W6_9DINO|nr:unnamed protein product [Effrenium voratum]
MGESLLRAHVQALKGKVPQVQRMELEDNILELKVAASGVYRLNFLVYEVDAYPDSGGVMMSEDEAATELVDAINARLEDAARLLVSEVLQITLQALEVSWQPDVDMQDGAEETVAFEGEDEGGGVVAVEQTFERCLRPGWKKLKWQEVEDQRLASREKRRRGADLTNEEQKAAEKQIFNSSEAFGILSNELYSLQTQGNGDIQADAVDFSVYHWAVKLRGFSKLAPGLAELRAAEGYDYVELRVVFKEDLHPFYPPSITLVRPRLCGSYDVQAALVCHPRLQLKGWSPFLLSSDLLLSVRAFLDRIARVDLGSPRNNVQNFPEGAFSPLERLLVQLGRLREVAPQNLRPAVPGNAYEEDPWASGPFVPASASGQTPAAMSANEGGYRGWAKGVGYGSNHVGERGQGWDFEALHAAQAAQDQELQQLVGQIRSHLWQELQGGREELAALLAKSCLVPFLAGELATSYTDMGDRPVYFEEVLGLVKELLVLLPAEVLGPLLKNLGACKAAAEVFLRSLPESESFAQGRRFAELVVEVGTAARQKDPPVATGEASTTEYCRRLAGLRLDSGDLEEDHSFLTMARAEICAPQARTLRLAKELAGLGALLPLSDSSVVLVRTGGRLQQLWRALITGPEDTPYSGGCFVFDIYFPPEYPTVPPQVRLLTTGGGTVCFNPNLYSNGKVCLSLLGTWPGERAENWDAKSSRAVQVLVSIQSLILVPEPYFNEPGFEREIGTSQGQEHSARYNAALRENCVRWAMIDALKRPKKEFAEAIKAHFKLQADKIQATIRQWIAEAPAHAATLQVLLAELQAELGRL